MADSGTIKWFSNAKGFGFIVHENGTQYFLFITAQLFTMATEH